MSRDRSRFDDGFALIDGSLQLEQDLRFQRRQWIAQRIGWGILWALMAAALAGLLGRGPLSKRTAVDPSGTIAVEYDRFQRERAKSELHLTISPAAVRDGRVQIWIDDAYLRRVQIDTISPPPVAVRMEGTRQVYAFAVEPSATPVRISLHYEHQSVGSLDGRVGIAGGPEVSLSQFVYP